MKNNDLQPIINSSALKINNGKIIVIADLHIGIEKELSEQGINTESKTSEMLDKILDIIKKNRTEEIILLGDIKHNIPTSTYLEKKDVTNFLKKLKKEVKIHIIPGNHDGNINRLIDDEINLYSSEGYIINDIGFIHGHRWPKQEIMNCRQIIMGHTHPTVMLKDRLEHRTFEPCWIKTKFIKEKLKERYPESEDPNLLIMPAFNPLCGGIAINKDGVQGPIGKIIDIENSEIYLLDSTNLGKVKDLK